MDAGHQRMPLCRIRIVSNLTICIWIWTVLFIHVLIRRTSPRQKMKTKWWWRFLSASIDSLISFGHGRCFTWLSMGLLHELKWTSKGTLCDERNRDWFVDIWYILKNSYVCMPWNMRAGWRTNFKSTVATFFTCDILHVAISPMCFIQNTRTFNFKIVVKVLTTKMGHVFFRSYYQHQR